jgi:subtilisin-like proprotein convertase family protein
MKLIAVFALLAAAPAALASTIVMTDSVMTTIPDGTSSGVARSLLVSGSPDVVSSVTVEVNISPSSFGFAGDLYVYLTNGSQVAVLMNRPGRRSGAAGGYGDDQSLNVVFSDSAIADFHNYRIPLTGSHSNPASAAITGNWQPDGRAVDPAMALDTSPRSAMLGVFAGQPANGTWSLFAADLSSGATHQIDSWKLTLDTAPIPEPAGGALTLGALLGALARRRRGRQPQLSPEVTAE